MKLERLFQVVVVLGGASIGSACDAPSDGEEIRKGPAPDASTIQDGDAAAHDAAAPDATSEDLAPCFCDSQACCDRSEDHAELAEGFECCWATTCP